MKLEVTTSYNMQWVKQLTFACQFPRHYYCIFSISLCYCAMVLRALFLLPAQFGSNISIKFSLLIFNFSLHIIFRFLLFFFFFFISASNYFLWLFCVFFFWFFLYLAFIQIIPINKLCVLLFFIVSCSPFFLNWSFVLQIFTSIFHSLLCTSMSCVNEYSWTFVLFLEQKYSERAFSLNGSVS